MPLGLKKKKNSKEETIQGRKLYEEIRYPKIMFLSAHYHAQQSSSCACFSREDKIDFENQIL